MATADEPATVPVRVYLDTSVLSYYAEMRSTEQALLWRGFSRELLDADPSRFAFWVSDLVIAELAQGQWQGQDEAVSHARRYPRLLADDRVVATAEFYRQHFLTPSRPPTDSLHLALACVHRMDILATWNFRHLANPAKRSHLRVLNARIDLPVPDIVSPLELLEVEA